MNYPLAPVLEHYGVMFRPVDRWQKVLCPVHEEHRPSCSVNLEFDYLTCHACGFQGRTVDLVAAKEGVSREAAAAICARIAGSSDDGVPRRSHGGWRNRSGRVPQGKGYRPKYGGDVSARVRRNR